MTTHQPWLYKPNKKKFLIFFIGMNPGKTNIAEKKAFYGNKTGHFIHNLLTKYKLENVYLTNVSDNELLNDSNIIIGSQKLYLDIIEYKPKIIVTFGKLAENIIKGNDYKNVINLPHPSYVIRFNLETERLQIEDCFKHLQRWQNDNNF